MTIWEKYKKKGIIGIGKYGNIYKGINKKTGQYVAIKEISKKMINNKNLNESEIINKIKNENIILIKETINTKEYFYIIMELCICNLEEYIKMRDDGLNKNEIRKILIQINSLLKKKLVNKDLKTTNILICINRIDKCLIKLSNYNLSKDILNKNAPEILNNEKDISKINLWNIGILIYYMCFKEYPYYDKNKNMLLINSGKKINQIKDIELNDLMDKLLKINIEERINWDDYFNHSFFKQLSNFECNKHFKQFNYYCKSCKLNICDDCLEGHNNHEIISFSYIGLNNNEIETYENLFKEIDENINSFNKIKNDILSLFNKMKLINENTSIYENDDNNNYKKYYIDYLKFINNKIKIEKIKIIDYNYIIGEYENKNEEIRILNSHDEVCREGKIEYNGISNEKDIKDNCEIYINEKKINFCYKYNKLEKKDKNIIKIIFNKSLSNTNWLFKDCSSITSLNLSNFNTKNVNDMNNMFRDCSSLTFLNLVCFHTNIVIDMNNIFRNCSSLTFLNLSSFNTSNVNNMSYMFSNCYSLKSLDLSNFNTIKVKDMNNMFSKCSSLISLNLSKFETNNVNNMSFMFRDCSSLNSLNLSNFDTIIVNNMCSMFRNCFSLKLLDLSSFHIDNATNIESMFSNCYNLTSLNLSNFNTNKVTAINNIFLGLNKNCNVITEDKKLIELLNKKIN